MARESVRRRLRDPDSAVWQNVWAVRATYEGTEGVFACGEVNARNGFGGYGGHTPFVAFGSMAFMPEDGIFEATFNQVCLGGERVMELRS